MVYLFIFMPIGNLSKNQVAHLVILVAIKNIALDLFKQKQKLILTPNLVKSKFYFVFLFLIAFNQSLLKTIKYDFCCYVY